MANRYFSNDSLEALKEHFKEYWITSPVDGVNLKLDIIGEETLTADNDVTDHYVESNVAYQDQITIKPKIYTIQGEVGELVWYQKDSASQKVGQVAQRLEGVVSFLPVRSRSFSQMKKNVMKASQIVDTVSNIWDRFDTLTPGMTKQQQAYNWLLFWRNMRAPITVESPWGTLVNYVITSLRMSQPRETKDKSLISITFKEFRTTSVTTVEYDEEKFQGYGKYENQPKVDNGNTDGTDTSISETVTSEENNPFYVEGDIGGESRTEYVANVTDGNEKYKVFYDTRYKGDVIVTSNGQTIIDNETRAKVFSAAQKSIDSEINLRGDKDYSKIMGYE